MDRDRNIRVSRRQTLANVLKRQRTMCKVLARTCRNGRPFFEELFFTVDERVDVVGCEFESVPMRDGIGRARFDAVPAEYAPRIINVIHARITLTGRDPICVGVLRRFNVDAVCRAGGCAKKTAHTFLKTAFVALQHVDTPIARLKVHRLIGVVFRDGLSEHVAESQAEALYQRPESFPYFTKKGWHRLAV